MSKISSRLNFSFVIPYKLAGMAMPGLNNPINEEVSFLLKSGITTLINLGNMDYFDDIYLHSFKAIDVPVPEFKPPSHKQMVRIKSIYKKLPKGNAMGVHCAGGVGRTGVVLACLLVDIKGITGGEAIKSIRDARPGSIESKEQESFVMSYLA